jgi:ADP-ribosylglycohydrolase
MRNLLLSVAIGDIAGMPYEFKGRTKDYNAVDLLLPTNTYTDDTVCTFACAEALLKDIDIAKNLRDRCRADFHRGFGERFKKWLLAKDIDQPSYHSFGNGSGMRVSAAGFMAKNVNDCIDLATKTALPTHDHPEGIKGAIATALAIHYGLQGKEKDYIRHHVLNEYYPNWSNLTYANIKPGYNFDATCQQTIPAALICFLESKDYVDCLKLAIALGGDADTLAAISGPIAYAFYKYIPEELIANAKAKLPEWMLQVNEEFDNYVNDGKRIQQTNYIDNDVVRPDYTPDAISSLKADEVFVFGSNLHGHHGGGAARVARKKFGAIWGQGVGLQGQSYAIPTMQGGVETIKPYVDQFIKFAKEHTELFFYVTRIGCGIAGFKDSDIAPLFKDAMAVENICLPKSFVKENEKTASSEVPQELLTMMYGQVRTLIDILKVLNKNEPIKDSDDARERLTEITEHNVRYGDEFAFMAMRTIWCIMSRYEREGSKVDIEQMEKDMLSFHDGNEYLKANHIEQIFYNYSVRKMVKYIQFLNEFRRYSDYESIREDLQSIPVSHCSSNDPQYYYSFYEGTLFDVWHILLEEWDNVTKNGKLDNDLLEQVAFGRFDKLVKEHGLKETIRLAYGDVGCHPDIQAPYMYNNERIWGPIYRIDGKHIEKGCSDFRRWPWTNTSFEMKFAHKILERDKNYMCVGTNWIKGLYLPISDYTLPVYSRYIGKMHFESQVEKIKFIEDHKTGRNAD